MTIAPTNITASVLSSTEVEVTWDYENNSTLATPGGPMIWSHDWSGAVYDGGTTNVLPTSPDGFSYIKHSASNEHIDRRSVPGATADVNGVKIITDPNARNPSIGQSLKSWVTGESNDKTSFRQEFQLGAGGDEALLSINETYWIGYSMYMPSSGYTRDTAVTGPHQHAQLIQPGGSNTYPMYQRWQVGYSPYYLWVLTGGEGIGSGDPVDRDEVNDFDRWIDWVYKIRLGTPGAMTIWRDGKVFYDRTASNWGTSESAWRFKMGMYSGQYKSENANSGKGTAHYGPVKMAHDPSNSLDYYELVAPSPCQSFTLELYENGSLLSTESTLDPARRRHVFTVSNTAGKSYDGTRIKARLNFTDSTWDTIAAPVIPVSSQFYLKPNVDNTQRTTHPAGDYAPPAEPLATPVMNAVTNIGDNSMTVNWAYTANTPDHDGFELERRAETGAWTQIGLNNTSQRTYNAVGLQEYTDYSWRIKATSNSVPHSLFSNTANGRTTGYVPPSDGIYLANRPSGYSTVTEHLMTQNPWPGWGQDAGSDPNGHFDVPFVDPGAVGQRTGRMTYEVGFSGRGIKPWSTGYNSLNVANLYLSFRYRCSVGFQNHTAGVNKIFYCTENQASNGAPMYLNMGSYSGRFAFQPRSQGAPSNVPGYNPVHNFHPNRSGDPYITPGQWYHCELEMRMNSAPGVNDAVLRVWVNGQLTHEYTDYRWSDYQRRWNSVRWEPIWGGTDGSLSVNPRMYQEIDYIHISGSG